MSEIIKKEDSRRIFLAKLIELAENDNKIILLYPDVGFNYIEEFQKRFPERCINTGVTEQSTIMMAAGLAIGGFKPYVYSMINFVVFRPFEMVRNGVAMHKANVKLIGVRGSDKYKFLGFSHNMIFEDEDMYHLKPYMDCFAPKSKEEIESTIESTYQSNKFAYIRL